MPLRMPPFEAVVPPQNGTMWGGTRPKKFLLASLALIFVPPTLKIVAPPLRVFLDVNSFVSTDLE